MADTVSALHWTNTSGEALYTACIYPSKNGIRHGADANLGIMQASLSYCLRIKQAGMHEWGSVYIVLQVISKSGFLCVQIAELALTLARLSLVSGASEQTARLATTAPDTHPNPMP